MPIYEYSCTNCGATQTEMRRIADRHELGNCEKCGGKTEFKISTPYFKGSGEGWYGRAQTISSKNLERGEV